MQIILPVLLAFHTHGGVDVLNSMTRILSDVMLKEYGSGGDEAKAKVASYGLRKILDLYAVIVNGKASNESAAQFNLVARSSERRPDSTVAQLTVEIRSAVLPVMRHLWESNLIEKGSGEILTRIIDVLKMICLADYEPPAHKSDKVRGTTNLPACAKGDRYLLTDKCSHHLKKHSRLQGLRSAGSSTRASFPSY